MQVPSVEKKIDPVTVVDMQYWLAAGTELLAKIAQIGKRSEVTKAVIIRPSLSPFLRIFRRTGWVMFSELGPFDATSWFEHVLISGSESHGVIRRDPITVVKITDRMSPWSMTF